MSGNYSIVLTGGGSGGHVIPALSLIPDLSKNFQKIYFAGGSGIEKQLAEAAKIPFFEIRAAGLDRRRFFANLKVPFILIGAVCRCIGFLKQTQPDVVFGKGGYVGLPTVLAARLLKIPAVCHESDLSLGLSNKIAKLFGAKIITGFHQTSTLSPDFVYTGFPLKKNLFSGDKRRVIGALGLDAAKKTVLVTGGSLGSVALNNVLRDALPSLLKSCNVIHLTGKGKENCGKFKGYFPLEFTDKMEDFYAAADIVISRCGAGALAEISILKKPAVFIPLPKNASRGDQLHNAEIARDCGAAVIYQENLTRDALLTAVYKNIGKPMRPVSTAGNTAIAGILTSLAEKKRFEREKAKTIPTDTKNID